MTASPRRSNRFLLAAVCFALATYGCVLQSQPVTLPTELPIVSYQGSVLLVDGNRYPHVPTESSYVPGNVLLLAQPGKTEGLLANLVRFGLKYDLHRAIAGDWCLVEVPVGFETQWITAFRATRGVASAHLNHRLSLS